MTRSFRVFMALGAVTVLGAAFAQAQDEVAVRANIPFRFHVGKAILPPGEYVLRFDDVEMGGVLRVRSEDGHEGVFALTQNATVPKGAGEPTLVFDKYGSQYVLKEVVDPDADRALQLLATHPPVRGEEEKTPTD
jgi:hypothetical protein